MAADLALQIGWVQTFFLRKYLFLLQFLNLKIPTEDSILRHKSRSVSLLACLLEIEIYPF
jgi:hypothetical protein